MVFYRQRTPARDRKLFPRTAPRSMPPSVALRHSLWTHTRETQSRTRGAPAAPPTLSLAPKATPSAKSLPRSEKKVAPEAVPGADPRTAETGAVQLVARSPNSVPDIRLKTQVIDNARPTKESRDGPCSELDEGAQARQGAVTKGGMANAGSAQRLRPSPTNDHIRASTPRSAPGLPAGLLAAIDRRKGAAGSRVTYRHARAEAPEHQAQRRADLSSRPDTCFPPLSSRHARIGERL